MRKVTIGLLATVVVVGVILAVGGQSAYAQGPGRGPRGGPWGEYGPFGPGGWGGFGLSPVAIAAEALGMDQADLIAELRDGKTIAQVAEEQGVDLQTVVDAIVDAHAERLNQAVEAGWLTQEEADERLSQLAEDMAERLSEALPFWGWDGGPGFMPGFMGGYGPFGPGGWGGFGLSPVAIAAEALGMDQADLVAELRDGKTIAQVAEEQGVDLQTVVDAIVDAHAERLNQAVEAGRLTQEEADERLSQLAEDMAERLSETLPFWGWDGGPGFMGGRGPMPHGGRGGRGGPWGR